MLRKKSIKKIGFIPDIVTDVGYATLPCVSGELAESCSHFVTTIVMQDDIIHRLSAASPARLRNEFFKLIDSRYRRLISNDRKISMKFPERHRCALKSKRLRYSTPNFPTLQILRGLIVFSAIRFMRISIMKRKEKKSSLPLRI
ncbi:PREDICTED: uncharacterized protein LOC105128694 [Populus euphratica]|uniref:Uncharacterized protein LOC105128694 n=1 Tax=Populus euphratica TaxID=75702 RepID=A0AAJ6XS26_POPEU|nr:PREDICTED: uncharacterized protein LOC105128694 [Populus euphratica]XP_011028779.1 PREDICTED: uncharacterized protein LOC105128694 [Populus euphratica]